MEYFKWKNWDLINNFGLPSEYEIDYFESIMRSIPGLKISDARCLEVGFGNGGFLGFCNQRGISVVGIEIQERLINAAHDSGFEAYSSISLVPDEKRFNLIIAIDVLEHIKKPELIDFLRSLVHKTTPQDDAFIVLRFPNGDSPFSMLNQNGDLTHQTYIGSAAIAYIAQSLNLEVIKLGGDIFPYRPNYLVANGTNLLRRILYACINLLVKVIFQRGKTVDFCSENLLVVLKHKVE